MTTMAAIPGPRRRPELPPLADRSDVEARLRRLELAASPIRDPESTLELPRMTRDHREIERRLAALEVRAGVRRPAR